MPVRSHLFYVLSNGIERGTNKNNQSCCQSEYLDYRSHVIAFVSVKVDYFAINVL